MAMTMKKSLCVALILAMLVVSMVEATQVMAKQSVDSSSSSSSHYHLDSGSSSYGSGSLKSYQCGGQCNRRCSQTQYKKPCLFFCNKCCAKCLCVPPGYYGNKQVCPCYNNWKTKRGGPKCP